MRIIPLLAARRLRKQLERGKFKKIVGRGRIDDWMKYVQRQASIPHNKHLVIRITVPYSWVGQEYWFLWVRYLIIDNDPISVDLAEIYIPDSKKNEKTIPEEIEGMEYFKA